ncbi:Helix-hairpin-helix motif-containing protein [Pedobacter terrae]|uniref:Helix-hairpin-helix motif-containing protein n=1 Tax=Pedobacter terrae TaxID=405671 RepID=A0A1G7NC68_9SPHI|nr:helix-hairpin-helix domain-containing protein [Pedobacter terrae]SDF70900.1 Helix-hairpin-helix motif-containing protein [Pedobacter terrae]
MKIWCVLLPVSSPYSLVSKKYFGIVSPVLTGNLPWQTNPSGEKLFRSRNLIISWLIDLYHKFLVRSAYALKILTVAFVTIGFGADAQTNTQEADIRDILESMAENLPDDYDMTELIDVLERYRKHPINLNRASVEELNTLVFLSPLQIGNIFNHIKENGPLADVLELQSIPGFDVKTIQNLLPFVTLTDITAYQQLSFKNLINAGENDLTMRFAQTLQKQKGYTDLPGNRYLGSPERFQMRYRYQYSSILSAAFTLDKDAGEKFAGKPFDFYSGNIALFKLGKLKKLVIGDYTQQFGQGLTLWSGFSFGKGPDVTSVAKKDLGLRPYNSTNEYSFFRGAAATINLFKNVDITPFISFRNLDASQKLDADGNLVQSTINQTGLHRTPTELKNKGVLAQTIYGTTVQYSKNDLAIGTIAYHTNFKTSFITQTAAYDRYSFTGKSLTNLGLFYNYTYKNMYLYGEGAKGLGGGFAYINGVLVSLSSAVSAAITYRNYAKDYHNFFNQAVSESSEAINERGLYAGLNINPNKYWAFSFYGDLFRFPWLKYRVDEPSKGYEVLGQAIYTPSKTFKILVRFKSENKQQNTDLDVPVNFLDDLKREGYRAETNWQLNKNWHFQNRLEVSQYKKGSAKREFGYLIYQDIDYSPMFAKLTGNVRFAYFNTPSYNSRIYAYEDDVLYSFAFGMYNGKGFRTYLNMKYNIIKRLDVWFRYGLFIYKDVKTVGTYLDEIKGNKKSEVKIQVRYQF